MAPSVDEVASSLSTKQQQQQLQQLFASAVHLATSAFNQHRHFAVSCRGAVMRCTNINKGKQKPIGPRLMFVLRKSKQTTLSLISRLGRRVGEGGIRGTYTGIFV